MFNKHLTCVHWLIVGTRLIDRLSFWQKKCTQFKSSIQINSSIFTCPSSNERDLVEWKGKSKRDEQEWEFKNEQEHNTCNLGKQINKLQIFSLASLTFLL
jgi:hypothetical protein